MSGMISFGIYFGNSSCCLAVNRDGKIDVVANAAGDRVTPAVVGFHDNEVVVGTSAKQALVRHGSSSVAGALRAIGSTAEEEIVFPLNLKCQLLYDTKKPKFAIQNDDKSRMVVPEEVIKHIFILLKDIALSHSNEDKLPVVICLPAWVTDSAIAAVHHSANSAGFDVLSTITQPGAACLAYDLLDDNLIHLNVVFFHCGGSSTVAAVAEVAGGMLTVKETYSSNTAGDALTIVLVDHFAKEFYMKYKGNAQDNKRSKRKLYSASENCKHVLSTMSTSQVYIESLWEGVDFSTQLSRARFDGLVSSTISEFMVPVGEVLQRSGLNSDQIQKVVLTGGSCKIPKLQKLITDTFPKAEILKKFLPDETLAIGAASESALYLREKSSRVHATNSLMSCLSSSIFTKILDAKDSYCIFSSGTPTYSRKSLTLKCPTSSCSLIIYEGLDANDLAPIEEERILAQIDLNLGTSISDHLQLDFALKNDGSLVVKLTEPSGKLIKSFTVEASKIND